MTSAHTTHSDEHFSLTATEDFSLVHNMPPGHHGDQLQKVKSVVAKVHIYGGQEEDLLDSLQVGCCCCCCVVFVAAFMLLLLFLSFHFFITSQQQSVFKRHSISTSGAQQGRGRGGSTAVVAGVSSLAPAP